MTTLPNLKDFDRWRDESSARKLVLPVREHEYEFSTANLTYRAGLLIKRWRADVAAYGAAIARGETPDPTASVLTPEEERYLFDTVIPAETRKRWETDDITMAEVEHVRETVIVWLTQGIEVASLFWQGVAKPEADANPPVKSASTKTVGSSTRKKTPARPRRSTGATSSARGRTSKPGSTPTTA